MHFDETQSKKKKSKKFYYRKRLKCIFNEHDMEKEW